MKVTILTTICELNWNGARRAEIAALKWSDINLEDAILHIAHGKGDRERDSTIVGSTAILHHLTPC
ncbi:MAG: hypothetical protein L0Z53_07200 [Acidobacteriales bacterium]|nr:hypothetical protein [Terriglobales bacterium]